VAVEERTAVKPIQLSNRGIQALKSRSNGRMCIVAGSLAEGSAATCLRLPMASKLKDMKNKDEFNLLGQEFSCGFGICGS
jgi:hypothetical protein